MQVDYTSQVADMPPHHVTVTAGAAVDTVTVTVADEYDFAPSDDPRRLGNAMVWVDGVLATQLFDWNTTPPYRGHAVTSTDGPGNRRTVVFTLSRDLFPVPPGAHEVTVSLWQENNAEIGYFQVGVTVPDRPVKTLAAGKILRTAFLSDPLETRGGGITAAQFAAAGFNAVAFSVFLNPGDNAGHDTLENWRAWSLDSFLAPRLQAAAAGNLLVYGVGDDFCRNGAEQAWLLNTPWAVDAIRETAAALRDSGRCLGVKMIDESPETLSNNQAYVLFRDTWRSVPGAPPICWPNLQKNDESESAAWSDYTERFWTTGTYWRSGSYDGHTLWEFAQAVSGAVSDVDTSRPLVCQLSVCGPFYTKQATGGNYQPGVDVLLKGATKPYQIIATTWIALAGPTAGLDAYGLDTFWAEQRADSPIGTTGLQTGARPGDERWAALSVAFNSVAAREALLTSGHFYAPQSANGWHMGRRGALSWYVNTLEVPLLCSLSGVLLTLAGEVPFSGGMVPPGGVVLSE